MENNMIEKPVYLFLLSPLHTGGTTQEGNLLGIARESHTNLPYIPSSSIRGRLRACYDDPNKDNSVETDYTQRIQQVQLFGPDLSDTKDGEFKAAYQATVGKAKALENLEQGALWIGDGSILWMPVPSLSHGVIWVSCPYLLQRWARVANVATPIDDTDAYRTTCGTDKPIYLKDAILKPDLLQEGSKLDNFVPAQASSLKRRLVLPDQHCATLFEMSLWRQVKVKLDADKTVDGGFRYEEAIPPDTLMYFPWGTAAQLNGRRPDVKTAFHSLIQAHSQLQIGGQEGLGRGFVQTWLETTTGGNGNV